MKYFICLGLLCACTSTSTPTLTPLQAVGCAAETSILSGVVSTIKTTLNCTNQAAIQTSLQTTLGNINLCTPTATIKVAGQAKGIIGNIACPMAVNAVMGYVSNDIPAAWGCSASSSASTLNTALTSACEVVVPL